MSARNFLRRAIQSGDLARALGGTGNDGSGRDLVALIQDCKSANRSERPISLHHIAYRFDLPVWRTREVLERMGLYVPTDEFVVDPTALILRLQNMGGHHADRPAPEETT